MGRKTVGAAIANQFGAAAGFRYKSDDVGDVIGIDLGTTNSCVSIMVSSSLIHKYAHLSYNWGTERRRGKERGGEIRKKKEIEWNGMAVWFRSLKQERHGSFCARIGGLLIPVR